MIYPTNPRGRRSYRTQIFLTTTISVPISRRISIISIITSIIIIWWLRLNLCTMRTFVFLWFKSQVAWSRCCLSRRLSVFWQHQTPKYEFQLRCWILPNDLRCFTTVARVPTSPRMTWATIPRPCRLQLSTPPDQRSGPETRWDVPAEEATCEWDRNIETSTSAMRRTTIIRASTGSSERFCRTTTATRFQLDETLQQYRSTSACRSITYSTR